MDYKIILRKMIDQVGKPQVSILLNRSLSTIYRWAEGTTEPTEREKDRILRIYSDIFQNTQIP